MRRPLIVSLLFTLFVSSGAFAAAPTLTFTGTTANVTVAPGHRVLWMYQGSSGQVGMVADTDGDGQVQIPSVSATVPFVAMDVETSEFAATPSVRTSVLGPGAGWMIYPDTTGTNSIHRTSIGPPNRGMLWYRPGVGAWAPPAQWGTPLAVAREFLLVDIGGFRPVGPSPATPSGVIAGDFFFYLEGGTFLRGTVDSSINSTYPGRLYFQGQTSSHVEGRTITVDVIRTLGTTGTITTTCGPSKTSVTRPPAGTIAEAGVDYAAYAPQTLTFGPGEILKRCSFTLLDDGVYTDLPRLLLTELTKVTGGGIADYYEGFHTIQITDDDPAPVITVGEMPASVPEGDVTWSLPVSWSLTGAFRGTIQMNTWTKVHDITPETRSQTTSITVVADDVQSAAATRNISLELFPTSPLSRIARVTRTVTVVEDDVATLSASITAPATIPEGDSGSKPATVTVQLGMAMPADVTLTLTATGTANWVDFESLPKTVGFVAGQTQRSFTLKIMGDTTDESDETIILTATHNGVVLATSTITIVDDDIAPPAVTLKAPPVVEGNAGTTTATVTVSLATAHPLPLTITVNTNSSGTATPGTDFTQMSTSVQFLAGETEKTVQVIVNGDTLDESDETVPLIAGRGGILVSQSTLTIVDDDSAPVTMFPDLEVTERTGTSEVAVLYITLSGPPARGGTVQYETADDTARAGLDYQSSQGTSNFFAGQTSMVLYVPVYGDATSEGDERFSVRLFGASPGVTIADDRAYVIIHDDDTPVPATPVLSINDVEVRETNGWSEATFTLRLSQASSATTRVSFDTTPATATAPSDFESRAGVVTFAPGQTSQTVVVRIAGDTLYEETETFTLALFNADGLLLPDTRGACTILDDDPKPEEPRKRRAARH